MANQFNWSNIFTQYETFLHQIYTKKTKSVSGCNSHPATVFYTYRIKCISATGLPSNPVPERCTVYHLAASGVFRHTGGNPGQTPRNYGETARKVALMDGWTIKTCIRLNQFKLIVYARGTANARNLHMSSNHYAWRANEHQSHPNHYPKKYGYRLDIALDVRQESLRYNKDTWLLLS
jgi:hypothetical protein